MFSKFIIFGALRLSTLALSADAPHFAAPPPTDIIIRGYDSSSHALSNSIVYLVSKQANGSSSTCSGSVISKNLVLTAAHCLKDAPPADIEIKVRRNASEWQFTTKAMVVRKHPYYSASQGAAIPTGPLSFDRSLYESFLEQVRKLTNLLHFREEVTGFNSRDIAIIRVETNFPSWVVPLPIAMISPQEYQLNARLHSFGFGYSERDTRAQTGILRYSEQLLIGTIQGQDGLLVGLETYNPLGRSVCFADSGGPILGLRENQWFILGFHASIVNYCVNSAYSVYAHYHQIWIDRTIAELDAISPQL